MALSSGESSVWDWLGGGNVAGVPSNIVILAFVAIVGHIFLSRGRPGWYIAAIGANRKAARHAGIPVHLVGFSTPLGSTVRVPIRASGQKFSHLRLLFLAA
jgi:ribose/xylose/arabinose/galactoside ABC-type transport system permease subunit